MKRRQKDQVLISTIEAMDAMGIKTSLYYRLYQEYEYAKMREKSTCRKGCATSKESQ